MKMIVAVIKPSRLDAVLDAVTEVGASGLTVTEVRGYGRQKGKTEVYRGAEYEVKLLPKVKLEIAAPDDVVQAVIDAWLAAQNGGDFAAYQALYADKMEGVKRVGPRTWRFDRKGWLADRVLGTLPDHHKVPTSATCRTLGVD